MPLDPATFIPLASGDRVAFIAFRSPPRALLGVVVDTAVRDRLGNQRIRIAANGRTYLTRARWVRRIP